MKTRFIPSGFLDKREGQNCVVYLSVPDYPAGYYAIGYSGKRTRPDFHYKFNSLEERERYVSEYIERQDAYFQERAKARKAKTSFRHSLKVGDILYASWGYDQTNVDFFEVVDVPSDKSVRIRPVQSRIERSTIGANYVVPAPGAYRSTSVILSDDEVPDKGVLKRVRPSNTLALDSGTSAHLWDGCPIYETAAGWGH